jgi:hypothetical protein
LRRAAGVPFDPTKVVGKAWITMAIADMDPRDVAKGQAKTAALMLAADTTGAAQELTAPEAGIPPSARDARNRQAARARQAVVTRWLRQLNAPRP